MIFGSVINDNLKDEILVTVIATGFSEEVLQPKPTRPALGQQQKPAPSIPKREPKREREEPQQQEPTRNTSVQQGEDVLDIPTFLRNRNRRR